MKQPFDVAKFVAPTSEEAAVENRRASPLVGSGEGLGLGVESGAHRPFCEGDIVLHRPSGETWVLLRDERDGRVWPCGWPISMAEAADCDLIERRQTEAANVRQPSPNAEMRNAHKSGEPSP